MSKYDVHRGTDLLNHIPHEAILRVTHLLYLRRLYLQSFLEVEQVGDITQQSEIFCHIALFIMKGFQIELDSQGGAALGTQRGAYVGNHLLFYPLVHVIEQAHGYLVRDRVDEGHATCLCQRVLYLIDRAQNRQCV